MKRALIICLAIMTLLAVESSAEAGRRKERRTARKGGGGVYAGAYQRRQSNSGYSSVTKASYAEPTVAVAPTPAPVPAPAPAAPDLTITEISCVGDVLALTIQNIGLVPSPETRLEVALAQPNSNLIESQNMRVLPLLPNQSVRIRMHAAPSTSIRAEALVDPDHLVAESNEENNGLRVTLGSEPIAAAPPILSDDVTWSQPTN